MPEGDTIFRTARTLQAALGGNVVTRFETMLPQLARIDEDAPIIGRTIESIRAIGKHLLIAFSGDLNLRTHMRMSGIWHIYRAGEKWQRSPRDARVVIGTATFVAVAFDISVAEFLSGSELERQPELRALGPDLLGAFDVAEAVRRLRAQPDREIGDALLNQRALAGIGNIYKSESLFLCGVNPFVRVGTLDDAKLEEIVLAAKKLLRQSAESTQRVRRSVYSRGGEPCRRCGTPIAYRKQGEDARGTYWCPKCQG
jgi:endonuclease-8